MDRIDSVASAERGEINRHLTGRGRADSLGRGELLPTFPDVLPNLLHDLCDINLGTPRHILHDFSSCCTSPEPIRFDTFSPSTAITLQTSLASYSSKTI